MHLATKWPRLTPLQPRPAAAPAAASAARSAQGIEIVLPRLVDDAQEALALGRGIADCHVDLPGLKRRRIPIVRQADDVALPLARPGHVDGNSLLILNSFRPIPCARGSSL